MSALVRFERVTLGYGRHVVLREVSFSIEPGDFLGLVGPNGAGKTTVLRALLGSLRSREGSVSVAPGVRFGYVPQRELVDATYPLRVLDVILMGRYHRVGLLKRPGPADRERAHAALAHVGIGHLAERPLGELSGGQKQRMLIARALVGEPTVLVLDEPTDGMDLASTAQILDLVRHLHDVDRLTVVMVSHALNHVADYVRRLALVDEGVFRVGPVEEMLSGETLSQMYGVPVSVGSFRGHRIIVTGDGGDAGHA
jgi:ABC-type Mn2+/Zn2+ transport system ATPase subunit